MNHRVRLGVPVLAVVIALAFSTLYAAGVFPEYHHPLWAYAKAIVWGLAALSVAVLIVGLVLASD